MYKIFTKKSDALYRHTRKILLIMRMIIILLTAGLLQVSASSLAQITIKNQNTSFEQLFKNINQQAGYDFIYDENLIKTAKPVNLNIQNASLESTLDQAFRNRNLTYSITGNIVVVKERRTDGALSSLQQEPFTVRGRVIDSLGNKLVGASIKIKGSNRATLANMEGNFVFPEVEPNSILQFTFIGYDPLELKAEENLGTIILKELTTQLQSAQIEVLNTGYYQIPRERATGSFTHVSNDLLNRSVGGDILQRLEGVASGVQSLSPGSNDPADIRVRGVSTINSNRRPLIVIDNFPYEGNYSNRLDGDASNNVDLSFINPNDIESVTILKDAAAASIWGARAGNGVIVITTKQGRYGQKSRVSFRHNTTIGDKPDLLYNRGRLPSETVMSIEKDKYEAGRYSSSTSQSPFPAYVELLIKKQNGEITEEEFASQVALMKGTEIRKEVLEHLYQPSIDQQYALNVSGGGNNHRYYVSTGYDKNRGMLVGEKGSRLNLNIQNTLMPIENLEITAGIWYSQTKQENNGIGLSSLSVGNTVGISPYLRLRDEQGNALPVIKDYRQAYKDQSVAAGLLDWDYRPLDELNLNNATSKGEELRFNASGKYKFLENFNIDLQYQYNKGSNSSLTDYDAESYYVRNLVNRFTQTNGSLIIPHGDIRVGGTEYQTQSHSGRAQLNFQRDFGSDHSVSALAGAEIREVVRESNSGYYIYNYNEDILEGESFFDYTKLHPVRPSGSTRIPSALPIDLYKYTDRFLSYYGNASYAYKERYTLTGSLRWDASNLFGVKTNQKGTPLWSLGTNWDINEEDFYQSELIPYLRLRLTYGSAGNVYNAVSSYPTVRYNTTLPNYIPQGTIMSAGNPSLRWERVNTFNAGVDFASQDRRISGSFDYYVKKASDLIGEDYLAPSTGIITGGTAQNSKMINYANMRTNGFDLQLNSRNLVGEFGWESSLLINYVKNKITNVFTNPAAQIYDYYANPAAPVVDRSRDIMYAIPVSALDPQTGYQLMYIDGEQTTDYAAYHNSLRIDDLAIAGVTVPPFYGSLRNDFYWKSFGVSAMLSWKTGYVFRRSSIAPGAEYNGTYHMDYFDRWTQPGDEAKTTVPAYAAEYNAYGSTIYSFSNSLITKGDHIRLQDLNVSYTLSKRTIGRLPVQQIRLMAYARNLGVIWRSNDKDIDPDYANAESINPTTYSLGVSIDF